MRAIGLLCELIATGGKAAAQSYAERPGYDALLRSGLIREAGVIQSIPCDACSEPHDAEVLHQDGRYGYHCPELGFVPLDRAALTAILPDVSVLVERLADSFGCRRRLGRPIGTTWRIGSAATLGGDLTVYFHPRLATTEDARDLSAALEREVTSPYRLVVAAAGSLPSGPFSARLDDVVELDTETGDLIPVADLASIVFAPVKNPGGRPNLHREGVLELAQLRINTGAALPGLNDEARAIAAAYPDRFPDRYSPSFSTIKRYLAEARGGS